MRLAMDRIRVSPRTAIAVMSAAAALASATGIVQLKAFQYPSTLKYSLTILAPVVVLVASLIKRSLRAITATAIVVAPFAGATASIAGTRVSILVPCLLGGAAVASLSGPPVRRPASLATAGVLAFPLLAVPLAMGSGNRAFIVALGTLLVMGWLVARTAEEPAGTVVVLAAMAVSAAIQSAIAIWQARTGHQLNLYSTAGTNQFSTSYLFTYGDTRRPPGAFGDPISLGNMLAISLPPGCALALHVRNLWARLVLGAIALVTALALALTLSRAAWVGALAGLLVTVAVLPRPARRRLVPVFAGGLAAVAAVSLALAGPAVRDRLLSVADPTAVHGQPAAQRSFAYGDQNRLRYWQVALVDGFAQHPLAGIGIDDMGAFLRDHTANVGRGIPTGTLVFLHAHSTYFQLLGEGGLLALALLALFLRGLFRDARAGLRAHPVLGAGLAGGSVALLICWGTDWVIHNEPVAASVAVLLGAVAAAGRRAAEASPAGAA